MKRKWFNVIIEFSLFAIISWIALTVDMTKLEGVGIYAWLGILICSLALSINSYVNGLDNGIKMIKEVYKL